MRGVAASFLDSTKGQCGSTGVWTAALRACPVRKRRIGHRGRKTETIRAMIELQQPFSQTSIAAALKPHAPSPLRDEAETVAPRRCRTDSPACCGDIRTR